MMMLVYRNADDLNMCRITSLKRACQPHATASAQGPAYLQYNKIYDEVKYASDLRRLIVFISTYRWARAR